MMVYLALIATTPSILADVSQCVDGSGLTPCRPGFQTCPPGNFGPETPQYHVKDASCGENDPNGPSFDEVHGVYHLHYQARAYVRCAVSAVPADLRVPPPPLSAPARATHPPRALLSHVPRIMSVCMAAAPTGTLSPRT